MTTDGDGQRRIDRCIESLAENLFELKPEEREAATTELREFIGRLDAFFENVDKAEDADDVPPTAPAYRRLETKK